MTAFYDRAAATAQRNIAKFGQAVVLSRLAEGTYNPATGSTGTTTVTTQTVQGVEESLSYSDQTGGLVQAGDRKMMLAAVDSSGAAVVPRPGNLVTLESVDWTVVQAMPMSPGGQLIYSTVILRRP